MRVTASGPVRLRFELDYPPWRVGDATLHQHDVITLDAGSHLIRQVVIYRIEGAPCATVAAHAGAELVHDGAKWIAVWDTPQKASAGGIATALLLRANRRLQGHA